MGKEYGGWRVQSIRHREAIFKVIAWLLARIWGVSRKPEERIFFTENLLGYKKPVSMYLIYDILL